MQSLQDFGFLSILPPIITILLAITTRNIIVSLSIGTFSGSLILTGFQPFQAILQLVEGQIFTQISRPSNTQVLITLACIGGFVKLIESSKSIEAFAKKITTYISSPLKAQLAVWLGGIIIFFTDSGNSLILGPLFRPIFKELKICKEKLAFIIDTTSAPICILVPVIGWGAYIMSLIEQSYVEIGLEENAFSVLLNVMPYQFYAILALTSVPIIAFIGKDYGPMAKAQKSYHSNLENEQCHLSTKCNSKEDQSASIFPIFLPLFVLMSSITSLLIYHYLKTSTLNGVHIRSTLIISYLLASFTSALTTKYRLKYPLKESLNTFIQGAEKMVFIMIILVFAWSLSDLCKQLNISTDECIYIGDSDLDIEAFKEVGLSIAFNASCEELDQVADIVIKEHDFQMLIDTLNANLE